ncbi:MAG TPA: site-2 protease family protein [Anaerolineales bacterium]
MIRNAIRIGKVFGIEVGLDYSWFIIFVLITWSLAGHYLMVYQDWSPGFRLGLALVTALLFFISVLAHEFGHSLVAIATGTPVRSITLFIFGGIAQITREPKRPLHEFLIAIAGPLVSFGLAAAFGGLLLVGQLSGLRGLEALGSWLGRINLILALFNLIPGFPLDGGRVFRSIVWGLTGNLNRATRLAGAIGQGVAWLFILVGIWQIFSGNWANGLWIAFIGWFLNSAALGSVQQVALRDLLKGQAVRKVMMTDCPRVSPTQNLQQLVYDTILPSGRRCFPVVEDGHVLGLVTLHRIKEVPREAWPQTSVSQVMIPEAQLLKASPDEELYEVMERMSEEDVNQLPVVDQNGQWIGLVARDNILNFIRTRAELTT